MPRAQFSCPQAEMNITKYMSTPRKYQDLASWYKSARKSIPQIPCLESSDWQIFDETVTEANIIFELRDSVGNKAAVIIERKVNIFTKVA